MIQGYYYGIVRDGEFMPCTPTVAHLVPILRTLFFATENLSLPSTPGTYNQEIQVGLKLDLNPKLYKKLNSKFGSLHPCIGHYLEYSEGQLSTVAWTSTNLKKDKRIKVLNKDLQ